MPEYLLVANAAAGTADDEGIAAAQAVLAAAGSVEVLRTGGGPDDLSASLADVAATVVVAGGDGSMHVVVSTLRRLDRLSPDRPVGLVPLGTGNDFARAVGIPLDPAGAASVVVDGTTRRMDLLVDDDDGIVVNAVHVGIGAEAADRAAGWKDRLGVAAYPAGAVVAGATEGGWELRVTVDGELVADQRLLMVGVGNGTSIGGGTMLAPAADPGDGRVDVVISSATGPLARIGYAVAMRDGSHVERDDVLALRGREVTVEGQPFPVNADGELLGPFTARTWRVAPHTWSLFVPPNS
jgi:YegS/Rv2252/BmrU family lipid kinase